MSRRTALIYGAGALRAGAQGDRLIWALHRAALRNGLVPIVSVGALADASRTEENHELLEELIRGCEVEILDRNGALQIGEVAKAAETADLVAVATALLADEHNGAVVSTRQNSLRAAAEALGHELVLYAI
jgi:hypothetical protein